MTTYYMFGTYNCGAVNNISASRTDKCAQLIEKYGGEVILMHAILGEYDLVLIANFPDNETAMKTSIALNLMTDISFSTYPAITVTKFDEMVATL